jgi:Tfp pilus assembly protein PilX
MSVRNLEAQGGSAYLIVMLVLLVMTIVGHSLATVTDTERLIGSNERTVHRMLYTAESGLALSAASVLVSSDHHAKELELDESGTAESLAVRNRLELAPAAPLQFGPCNLCELNDVDTAKENAFLRVDHGLTATASRFHSVSGRRLGSKTLAETLELQPWRSPVDVFLATVDSAAIEKIRL